MQHDEERECTALVTDHRMLLGETGRYPPADHVRLGGAEPGRSFRHNLKVSAPRDIARCRD